MFRQEYTVSGGTGRDSFSTSLIIQGDFDGNVFNVASDRTIPLAISGSCSSEYYPDNSGGITSNRCRVEYNNIDPDTTIMGISLEHFGTETNTSPEGGIVGVHCKKSGNTLYWEPDNVGMGANAGETSFRFYSNIVRPIDCSYSNLYTNQSGTGADSQTLNVTGSLMGNQIGVCNIMNQAYGNWAKSVTVVWNTSLPIFDTDAHLLQYIATRGQVVEGLLNGEAPVIPDDYKYFMQNEYTIFRHYGLHDQTGESWFYNLRFQTQNVNDRMCLVNTGYSDGHAKTYRLYGATPKITYVSTSYGWQEYEGDPFDLMFVRTEGDYGTRYAIPKRWYTNLYYKDGPDSEAWARHYIETGDPAGADNEKEVARANKQKIPGKIGEPVNTTPNGEPNFTMSSGGRIVGLTSGQANYFFNEIFAAGNVQDFLDGTQLFGSNQIGAIRGFHYLPVDIDEICTTTSVTHVFLGSYDFEFQSAVKWVTNNNKMINCGSASFNETYGDYRDYEPYCKLAVMLPFCGTHELKISNYINKTVTIKYAVDVTTGACTAYLYADGVIIDSFDGSMQVNRPVTANDQQRQSSAVFEGLMKTGISAVGTVGQVAAGVATGGAAGAALGSASAQTVGSIAGGLANGGGAALGVLGQAANTLQMAVDNPISTRGSYGGILGLFGVMSPYFIFGWLRTLEPANEIDVVGKPSATGQAVGNFGGFLQTSAFQLASGFTGTDNEAEEIYNIVTNGIYL